MLKKNRLEGIPLIYRQFIELKKRGPPGQGQGLKSGR
ncbi:MAG: hypothetical protein ACI840_002168 [Ulvibacter sp.]